MANVNTSVEALIAIEGPADLTTVRRKEDTRNVIISARSNVMFCNLESRFCHVTNHKVDIVYRYTYMCVYLLIYI